MIDLNPALLASKGLSPQDVVTAVSTPNLILPGGTSKIGPIEIEPLADQSIFVRAAISGVVREAIIAACLTVIMILLFLGSWRSTLIIAFHTALGAHFGNRAVDPERDHQHHDPGRTWNTQWRF